jgi:acylphosphatase
MDDRAAKRVLYSGNVQGVGFRYTARQVAGDFRVAGFVRNLHDGRVELVAEGSHAQVQGFLDALSSTMASFIRGTDEFEVASCDHSGFEIRF